MALLACARTVATPSVPLTSGDIIRTLKHDNNERNYLLHVPLNFKTTEMVPLVLVFHGGGGNAENAVRMTGFSKLADEEGFLVVYPSGSGRLDDTLLTWNGGNCCGYALRQNMDDVGFVRSLLSDVQTLALIDPHRIYATGMSNGGIMSYRLACELSDVIAAIGPVAGTLNYDQCQPSHPVSVIHFHGTDDQHLPYTGGVGEDSLSGTVFNPVIDSIEFWAKNNGCGLHPFATESDIVRHIEFGPCEEDSAVELYTIRGGKHAWPGSDGPGWPGGDKPTTEPDATRVMWEFFKSHPK